jgi:thiaminase/transcriptional activator TenA
MEAERLMTFIDELHEEVKPQIAAQLAHPFVRGIAEGSLDPRVFENWVKQDYRYLIEYARVFGFCAARADTLEAMTWYANALHLTLATEMELHRQYAKRFDISAEVLESTPMWPTTRAYTDFLVRFAQSGDYAEAVAALLPCAWGYVDLAVELARGEPPEDQRYADWIAQYSSDEFREATEWLKNEMERVAADKSAVARERLVNLFVTSCRYELAFWEMCWRGEG